MDILNRNYVVLSVFPVWRNLSIIFCVASGNDHSRGRVEDINCLKYNYQIHDALTSMHPPFDNYFNISRAIFPSEGLSSKLINIWVHFTNSSVNLTQVGQAKYIWSRSCLYVSDRYLSLQAMRIYSMGTIWPDRRQEDLHITIPKFCNPQQTKAKLVDFLSTVSIDIFRLLSS